MSDIEQWLSYYTNTLGWTLIPIPTGQKGPTHKDWNHPKNCFPTIPWPANCGNLGLHHVASLTCCLDIDQLDKTITWFRDEYAIDFQKILDDPGTIQISSGKENRAKLLYRVPGDIDPATLVTTTIADERQHIVQFRFATAEGKSVQDVLPPSIHPDTGQPYMWNKDCTVVPELPPELLEIWIELLSKKERGSAEPPPTPSKAKVLDALEYLDPDMDRDAWVRVGMALHSTGDPAYEQIYDDWSAQGEKYSDSYDSPAGRWRSFKDKKHGVTINTLFAMARRAGWLEPDIDEAFKDVKVGKVGKSQNDGGDGAETVNQWWGNRKSPHTPPDFTQPDPPHTSDKQQDTFHKLMEMCAAIDPEDVRASHEQLGKLARGCESLDDLQRSRLTGAMKTKFKGYIEAKFIDGAIKKAKQQLAQEERGDGPIEFAHVREDGSPLDHSENTEVILKRYGIEVWYDEMKKESLFNWERKGCRNKKIEDPFIYEMEDLLSIYGLPKHSANGHIDLIATRNSLHPVVRMLDGVVWDGVSRFEALCGTIQADKPELVRLILKPWLLSAVAAVRGYRGMPPRGVLVFSGPQMIGKSTWLRYLVPEGMFTGNLELDTKNKDKVKEAVSHWICELGELDATFKRSEISALKGFISQNKDTIRLPYGKRTSTWARQTVFAGTVNDEDFLKDQTGNTRFWTIGVSGFDLDTMERWAADGTMLQTWAEIDRAYMAGGSWIPPVDALRTIEQNNDQFRSVPLPEMLLLEKLDWNLDQKEWIWLNMTEIAQTIGLELDRPNRGTELRRSLRRILSDKTGQEKHHRVKRDKIAIRGWKVPPKVITVYGSI